MPSGQTSRAEDEAREKLYAIKLLRLLSKRFSSKTELANQLGASLENISRYLSGRVLPTTERKKEIIDYVLSKDGLSWAELIDTHVQVSRDPLRRVVDVTHLLNDARVLDAVAFMVHRVLLNDVEYTKVCTVETDGIAFAKALAAVNDIDFVYARRKRPILIQDVLSEDILPAAGARLDSIFLPRKFLRPDESVVVVDDVIRSGATMRAVIKLLRDAGAEPQKAVSLVGVGEWESGHKVLGVPLHILRRYS